MTEKRQLSIQASVNDLASAAFQRIGANLGKAFRGAAAAIQPFRTALQSTQTLLASVLAGAAVRRGAQVFDEISEGLDKINQQATATNTSAASLQLLRNLASQNAVGFDQLAAALRTFEKNLGDANQGAKTQNETLRRLGLSTDDFAGTQKDAVEQLALVADGLSTIENESIRTNLALKVFGEDTGAALLPLLARGGDALREYAQAQREAGNALSDEEIRRVAAYRTELARLQESVRGLAEALTVKLAPAVEELFRDLRRIIEENGPAIRELLNDLATAFGQVARFVLGAAGLVRKAVIGLQETSALASLALSKLRGDSEGVSAATQRLIELNEQVEASDRLFSDIDQAFSKLSEGLKQIGQTPQPNVAPPPGTAAEIEQVASSWQRFWDGFGENSRRARDRWTDFRQAGLDAADQIVDRGLSGIANAMADVITRTQSAKEAFRNFARALLSDLARVIARLAIVRLLSSSLFGGSGGGGGSSVQLERGGVVQGDMGTPVPMRRFESGGIARGPTLALFGEGKASKGEAFVPLPDGRTIPVTMSGGGGQTFVFNISAMDGRDVQRVLLEQKDTIGAIFRNQVETNRRGMRQTLQRATS